MDAYQMKEPGNLTRNEWVQGARDAVTCVCKHGNISHAHGADNGAAWADGSRIGMGACGIDGCVCAAFADAAYYAGSLDEESRTIRRELDRIVATVTRDGETWRGVLVAPDAAAADLAAAVIAAHDEIEFDARLAVYMDRGAGGRFVDLWFFDGAAYCWEPLP